MERVLELFPVHFNPFKSKRVRNDVLIMNFITRLQQQSNIMVKTVQYHPGADVTSTGQPSMPYDKDTMVHDKKSRRTSSHNIAAPSLLL